MSGLNISDRCLRKVSAFSSSVIAIDLSVFVIGGKLDLYCNILLVSLQRLPLEEVKLDNICSKISDLYFRRCFLGKLDSLLYSSL